MDKKFTKTHEWVCLEELNGNILMGITDFAVEHLGDIVFLELTASGSISKGQSIGTIESVKSASDIYCPISGEIISINNELVDNLDRLVSSPYGDGWMIAVKPSNLNDLDELMSEDEYKEYIQHE